MANALVTVRQLLPQLAGSYRGIALKILDDPDVVVRSTITELAALCETSTTTVARFCTRAGFEGYKALRLAIAAAHSRDEAARELFRIDDAEIDVADDAAAVVAKVAFQEARAIEETARNLDLGALDHSVDALRNARRIVLYGAGSSGLTAQDLHQKLTRIDLASSHWLDAHLALTAAALTSSGDVVLGISHSGATRETQEILELGRQRGATTIAITNAPGSAVATAADHLLVTSAREPRYRTGAMTSRLVQLAVIDVLTVRLLQGDFDRASEVLQRTYDAVDGHRLPR